MNRELRAVAAGGPLTLGIRPLSTSERHMTTPESQDQGPKEGRMVDIKTIVTPTAVRLTEKMLAPGAGIGSKDPWLYDVRRDCGQKQKRVPLHVVCAIAFDDITHKGKSAAEVTAWARDFIAYVEQLAAERDGEKIMPDDLTPLLRREQAAQCREDMAELDVPANQDDPAVLDEWADASDAEMTIQAEATVVVRRCAAALRARAASDGRVPAKAPRMGTPHHRPASSARSLA